jgi:hypothetical protein
VLCRAVCRRVTTLTGTGWPARWATGRQSRWGGGVWACFDALMCNATITKGILSRPAPVGQQHLLTTAAASHTLAASLVRTAALLSCCFHNTVQRQVVHEPGSQQALSALATPLLQSHKELLPCCFFLMKTVQRQVVHQPGSQHVGARGVGHCTRQAAGRGAEQCAARGAA